MVRRCRQLSAPLWPERVGECFDPPPTSLDQQQPGGAVDQGWPRHREDHGGAASRRVPALHATLSENGDLLRQSSHRLSRRRRTPRRHRLDQAFIRHACTSPNETGEGVSVSWWLASLLCFLLFALERRTRAIVLPQTVSLYRPGEFYCSHRFHWGMYMPFQPFLFTHSLLNLSATTMYLQHFMLIFQTESGFSKKRCSDVQD